MNTVLCVKKITKIYKIYKNNSDRLKEIFLNKPFHKEFVSNNGISFELFEGDIITAVAGNSVGTRKHATALVAEEYAGSICTNGFRVLRNFKINPYYLLFYMKTEKFLKQMFMYRTGAAIPAVSDNDFSNIIIEIPDNEEMERIVSKIQKAFNLRNEAKKEIESIMKKVS